MSVEGAPEFPETMSPLYERTAQILSWHACESVCALSRRHHNLVAFRDGTQVLEQPGCEKDQRKQSTGDR